MSRLLLMTVIAATALLGASSAQAAGTHTVTETSHLHGQFDDPQGFNPCANNDDSVLWHVDGNLVEHTTFFPASDEAWGTFTETGTVNFTDGGVNWTGRFTIWGNFNQNERNGNSTFTANINMAGSDGEVAKGGVVSHVVWDGAQDPESPDAVFKLAFEHDHFIDFVCG